MNNKMTWEHLTTVGGRLNADALSAFLQAEGISTQLFQEGAGLDAFPVTFGPLGEVQIFVPKDKLAEAQTLLKDFERGVDVDAIENTEE